ncbi:hypothetical protein FLONG3_9980 [Fusarium longipes]|uniref:Uncharacterized protein n=1 Tax=Fusarium longipes TaxID=694270 RepID=A0A395RSY2_9HYPO|nr:hypothetical protein FLONG3_9980 [Fusarium longipes]
MSFELVFDDPWSKRDIHLGDAAAQHLELIEIFLKLLTHLSDKDGNISDETLAYSEWRYTVYFRMIDARGYSPHDIPPPWDVALIMYLHMLSPSRFYQYTHDNRSAALFRLFGLRHRHFPMTKMLSGNWYPRSSRKHWHDNSAPGSATLPGPNLPYQLWSSAPWETKPPSQKLTSMLKRNASRLPSSDTKWATPTSTKAPNASRNQHPRVVLMHEWFSCRTAIPDQGFKVWSIEEYTAIRTQRVEERCRSQSRHEEYNTICRLKPWPVLQDLRNDLEKQVSFWKVMVHAKNTIPGFVDGLKEQVKEYQDFLGLFHGFLPKDRYKSKLDPHRPTNTGSANQGTDKLRARFSHLLPPTLEIDLLWQTHLLYPAHYWACSYKLAGWILDPHFTPGAKAGDVLLGYTKERWKDKYSQYVERGTAVDQWFTEYVPRAAKFASQWMLRTDLNCAVNGRGATRQRRAVRRTGRNDDISGGGGGGDFSGGDGGCGGDGGGGGGGDGGG